MTRRFSSRRAVVSGLAAGGLAALLGLAIAGDDVAAKPKQCKRGEKRCGKRCIPKRRPCCKRNQKRCGAKCIAKSGCCRARDCGFNRRCLANNGCAIICTVGSCTGNCACFNNEEAQASCTVASIPDCAGLQQCSRTAQCRPGHHCVLVDCGAAGVVNLCLRLCEPDPG